MIVSRDGIEVDTVRSRQRKLDDKVQLLKLRKELSKGVERELKWWQHTDSPISAFWNTPPEPRSPFQGGVPTDSQPSSSPSRLQAIYSRYESISVVIAAIDGVLRQLSGKLP